MDKSSEQKMEIEIPDELNAYMLKTYGLGKIFYHYFITVNQQLLETTMKYYDDMIDKVKDPRHLKYLKAQKRYNLNKFKKDTEPFTKDIEKVLGIYESASAESQEAVDSFIDGASDVLDEMLEVKNGVISVKQFNLNMNVANKDTESND